jgi:hypothetical protein
MIFLLQAVLKDSGHRIFDVVIKLQFRHQLFMNISPISKYKIKVC